MLEKILNILAKTYKLLGYSIVQDVNSKTVIPVKTQYILSAVCLNVQYHLSLKSFLILMHRCIIEKIPEEEL